MTVREDSSIIERRVVPRSPADTAAIANPRLFATKFLYASLGVVAIIVLAAAIYILATGAGSGLRWMLLIGTCAVLLVAAALGRMRLTNLAGILVLATALPTLLASVLLPGAPALALLAATLLFPFAAIVVGWRGIVATSIALVLLVVVVLATGPGAQALVSGNAALSRVALVAPVVIFLLQGVAMLAITRHVASNRLLAHQHDEDLARLNRQLDEQRIEQRRTLDALDQEQRDSAILVGQLNEGVVATNAEGQICSANESARRIWQTIVGGEIEGQPITALDEVLDRSGKQRAVDVLRAGMRDGGLQQYILVDRSAIEYSERLRSELVKLIAVEMRNPLTSMLTALEMTLGEQLPDGTDRVLAGARRSGQRLLETVTTLLEINDLEHSPATLRRLPSPLRPLIEASIAQATPLAQQMAVNVVVEYNADGSAEVDGDRVRRAMLYLLDNAIRSSPAYSTVQVQTERQANDLLVRVIDQGPGIEPDEVPLVFHRYIVPGDQGNVPAIGLTFCRLVVEAHGGRIWVESTAHGSVFAFALPLLV